MAVDDNIYPQNSAPFTPSRHDKSPASFHGDVRRTYSALVAAAGPCFAVVAPWDCVIEEIRATQITAGGGAAQNVLDVLKGATTQYALAADGNTFVGDAAAGTTATPYPTLVAGLVEQPDGVNRIEVTKGTVINVVVTGANHGTVQYELVIAKVAPAQAL